MRFKKYITELSAQLKKFNARMESGRKFSTVFETDNNKFEFWAEWREVPITRSPGGEIWLIAFYRSEEEEYASGNVTQIRRYQVMGDLNSKEAIQVFAGVQKSLEIFVEKYKPKVFEFDAEDRDHMKLYDSLSKIIEKRSGYKLTTKQHRVKTYIFTRPLKEAYEKGFNSYVGYVEIFVNPSKKEIKEAAQGLRSVRFIADGRTRKLWVWNVNIMHEEAWRELGNRGAYFAGNMLAGEAEQSGSRWVMVSATSLVDKEKFDWSWLEKTIEVKDYIRKTTAVYRSAGVRMS